MKLHQIALASAALALSSSAFASLNSEFGVNNANLIYISGASALSGSLQAAITPLCTGGTANIRALTVDGATSNGRVIVCTSSPAGVAAGTLPVNGPFAVIKRDINGSFDGVGPVISGTPFAEVGKGFADAATCTAANCVSTDNTTAPDAGLTDVETAIWRGLNQTNTLSQPVPESVGITSVGGFAGQGFGLMVSEALYTALQNQQKADGRLATTCSGFTAGPCQPSISKAEYAAIAQDGVFSYVFNAALTGSTDKPINLCRRVETSGTQATSNIQFLNNACANTATSGGVRSPKKVDFVNSTTAVAFSSAAGDNVTGNWDDNGGAFGVFEGSGTGDARNCVIRRNSGKNPNDVADTLGNFAIGWISLENAPASGWKYVKLDGTSPNATKAGVADGKQRQNAIDGLYDAVFELELLYPTANPKAAFFGALKDAIANPNVLDTRGIYVTPGAYTNAGYPLQVSKGTRGGNSCAPVSLSE